MFKAKVEKLVLTLNLLNDVTLDEIDNLERQMRKSMDENPCNCSLKLYNQGYRGSFSQGDSSAHLKNFSFNTNKLTVTFDLQTESIEFVQKVESIIKQVIFDSRFKKMWNEIPS